MKLFQSLRSKINIAIAIIFLIISLVFGVILTTLEIQRRETVFNHIEVILTDLTNSKKEQIGNEIFAEQIRAIKSTLADITKRDGIISASVYNSEGELMVTTEDNIPLPSNLTLSQCKQLALAPSFIRQKFHGKPVLTFNSIINVFGEEVGYWKINYSLSTIERETYLLIIIFSALLITMLTIMGVLLNILLHQMVLKPGMILKKAMWKINKGNLGVQANQKGIQSRELKEMTETFNKMSTDLANSYHIKMAKEIAEASAHARSEFLNNSGQGFLSFGQNLLINDEYSLECENIFGCKIQGESIAILLSPTDKTESDRIGTNFIKILAEKNNYIQELYLSLLKKEYFLENKFIEAEYRVIEKNKMMLILTDITRHKKIENKIYKEYKQLKFAISAIQEANYFFEILKDFEKFCNGRFQELIEAEDTNAEMLSELYREVHTFKGLFAQQDFLHIPDALHQVENYLSKMRKDKTGEINKFTDLMEKCKCQEMLNKDLAIIKNILGEEFLQQKERRGKVVIPRELAEKIKDMSHRLLKLNAGFIDEKTRSLLSETKKILHVNLKKLIIFHLNNGVKLAERLGKDIGHFAVEGDDIFVNASVYAPFTRTLVHVFRNAVDHGIETPEEREELDKEEKAWLICSIKKIPNNKVGNKIIISVADNGKGLDTLKIRKKAVERGLFTKEDILHIPDNEIHHLIFNENFSTSETITKLSGRGVGLNSVRMELSKLNGNIEIETKAGKGTTFRFIIPIREL